MFGLAVMLKKGLHLNIIHNIDRPFEEMMLGLESWIPLYMTGQISPYYLKSPQNDVYCHFHYVSGEAALFGECIAGYHDKGRYYLTRHKDEVAHYKTITKCLFQKAIPLMDIYCKERKSEYEKFLFENAKLPGKRHHILSSLPLCTMSEELLKEILQQNKISTEDAANIFHFVTMQKEIYEQMLYSGPLQNDVPELTREEFEQYPMVLSLSGLFFESDIFYTYEQYLQHFAMWAFLGSPLIIGADIRRLDDANKATLLKKGLISIHQDPDCRPAFVIGKMEGQKYTLGKLLSHNRVAFAFFNVGTKDDWGQNMSISFDDLGIHSESGVGLKLTDAVTGEDYGVFYDGYHVKLAPDQCRILIGELVAA